MEVCFSQIGPAGAAQLLPRSGRNLRAKIKVQLLQGRVAQDFQHVCGPIGTLGVSVEAPGVIKRGRWGYKDCHLLPLLLQVTFANPTICNCLFHMFGLSTLPNVVKETALAMALNIGEKNAASQRTGQTSQRSSQNEALIKVCFSQIAPAGTTQLLPRSGRNLRAILKVQLL